MAKDVLAPDVILTRWNLDQFPEATRAQFAPAVAEVRGLCARLKDALETVARQRELLIHAGHAEKCPRLFGGTECAAECVDYHAEALWMRPIIDHVKELVTRWPEGLDKLVQAMTRSLVAK